MFQFEFHPFKQLFQADNVKVCDIESELKAKLQKFRFRKATDNAAIISMYITKIICIFS